jgi:uncharacterized protein (TIGR03067 family)
MTLHTILIVAAGLVLGQDNEVKKELERLQGTWNLVGRELDGKMASEDDIKLLEGKLVITGDKATYTARGDDAREVTIKIDPTAQPRAIEWTITKGPAKGEKVLAIYKIEGDRLTVCSGTSERRPKQFATKAGSPFVIIVWQKQKK